MIKINISEFDNNQSIISFVKKNLFNVSLSLIYKLLRTGKIKVNQLIVKSPSFKLNTGDVISIVGIDENLVITKKEKNQVLSSQSNYKIKIAYEDEDVILVKKPFGVITSSDKEISLSHSVINYFNKDNNSSYIVSPIHRLDKVAQGLVIFAKDRLNFIKMSNFLSQNRIQKVYRVKIEKPIMKDTILDGYICVNSTKSVFYKIKHCDNCKPCKTKIHKSFNNGSHFFSDITIENGRKHQIRASLSYLKNPIIGDSKYGSKKKSKIYLICYQVSIPGKKTISIKL